jgi:hypothetical protein
MTMRRILLSTATLLSLAATTARSEPPDAAAERKLLDDALGHIRDQEYVFAVARLAPLAKSNSLPAPVAKVIPGLIADLRSLDAVTQLATAPPDAEPPAVTADLLPAAVQRPYARLELSRAVGALLETPHPAGTEFPWAAERASKLLDAVAAEFDADAAGRLRVELSAKLFLAGKPQDATKLIENETPNEYAREVLADLRTIVLGGGTLANPQVARFVPEKGLKELPGAAALVPATLRDQWQHPKPPADSETAFARLEKRVRKDVTAAAATEAEKLTKKVAATADGIRAGLAKP